MQIIFAGGSTIKVRYLCSSCGHESLKWMGRCPGCGDWNTFLEQYAIPERYKPADRQHLGIGPISLTNAKNELKARFPSGLKEFDRVLGGGIVSGSLILIGGDPGIGKSTLLLQVAHSLCINKRNVLYVSGEESVAQIRFRAERLGAVSSELNVLSENDLEAVTVCIKKMSPSLVIIDSIQTMFSSEFAASPGSITQVRECTGKLLRLSKESGIPLILVGHVTKEGALAGPRVMEHMVDTVLYFEGERYQAYRTLRVAKNRFGSTEEVGIFEMTSRGLLEVADPSKVLLSQSPGRASGTAVVAGLEGSRVLLLEVQSLVADNVFSNPRRLSTGLDVNRINLMVAVMDKKLGLELKDKDIYLNVAGGIKLEEPAADLAICLAIASSLKNIPLKTDTVVFGEVGLTGEIRNVTQVEKRIQEVSRLGFKRCIIPGKNLFNLNFHENYNNNLTVEGVNSLEEAFQIAF